MVEAIFENDEVPEEGMENTEDVREEEPSLASDESGEESEDIEIDEDQPEGSLDDTNLEESEPDQQKYTVTIAGEDIEVTLDEALRGYQKARASDQKFMKAAALEEAFENKVKEISESENPFLNFKKFLSYRLGDDKVQELVHKAIIDEVNRQAEEAQLTEEQKKILQLQRENEALRQRTQERERKEKDDARRLEESKALEQLRDEIFSESKKVGLPQNALTLQKVAVAIQESIRFGQELSVKEAVGQVAPAYRKELIEAVKGVPLKDLPRELREAILKEKKAQATQQVTAAEKPTKEPRRRRREHREFSSWEKVFNT